MQQIYRSAAASEKLDCYFVVWSSKDLIVELIESNDTHYQNVECSLSIFFRSYIYPVFLGYKELFFCAKSEKVLLKKKTKLKKQRINLIKIASNVISVCAGTIISFSPVTQRC